MSIIEAIIIGIVQGITEFLPISSTAHIVITQFLFDYTFPGFGFEIFLHIASILAVILYFRKDLLQVIVGFFSYFKDKSEENRIQFMFAIYIIVATGITGVLGLLLEDLVGAQMKTPPFIAGALIITGTFLIIIERFFVYKDRTVKDMTLKDSIIVGLGQTLAVFPGISRSGATLITALFSGLNKETAVRYSFLLSIPVILGTSVLAIGDLLDGTLVEQVGGLPLIISFIVTFFFSWLGIIWLIDFLKRSKLIYFAFYCFALAIFVFFYFDHNMTIDLE
ncbi:undecaprenyl-diphosphate phosphatase [Halalkalibacterium halodurans]|uniref:Undecaprenyl-diphosphatase 2 n=1 Tax=Halalkalibacterium halodurans (strain ATCC BAA-125 / DSM 18197 / FERM 7344 / JCM 9153 / C-125) TaxID=272558 RepID=UPPP2_HALH5|nr:undecaprenyl-diphosphate phosphatase [Halalkalibacterium halodurans]Q9KCP8.1 RecName: Full=Undecaprenyl-diphosphatase 2; AltName: Full=Bacitracin resistance protein 2; AltName: Full=Undecaprenyl pyrophosphate phosphatase 2 [Halalkalibacterium halodurans C-125]MED4082930.1 undecaprenyl-diphosphate phosphatase [Halalkalibacterium halodurans]MED4084816.1 undecaprenyl-diphosphate phosphatase [Halalkalibacterium halodurans]MED4106076.1 undecaprenyl-diphosphate phosphatase [Halalkalibacterium halo